MQRKENPFIFRAKRFVGFLKILMRNKRGMLGLVIIAFFGALAVLSPLLTPYTPIGEDPIVTTVPLSDVNAAPAWFAYIPASLGGNPSLSQNMKIIQSPGLPRLVENGGEWKHEPLPSEVSVSESSIGFPFEVPLVDYRSQEGSTSVSFNRPAGAPHGEVKAVLYTEFEFPYTGLPAEFVGNIELLSQGTAHAITIRKWVPGKGFENVTEEYLDVPVKVTVFLGLAGGRRWKLWPPPYIPPPEFGQQQNPRFPATNPPLGFTVNSTTFEVTVSKPQSGTEKNQYWILSRDSLESGQASHIKSGSRTLRVGNPEWGLGKDPVPIVFTRTPGIYEYGIEITFLDTEFSENSVSTTIYLDDFGFDLAGTSFGLMGTDNQGRDLFAQLIYGTRISLYLGLLVAVMSVAIGLAVGLSAGYLGRFADELLMRFNDLLLVLPGLPLLIVLVAVLGASIENLIILMGLLGWNGFARLVRSQVLSLRERPFVEAAKSVGAGTGHIIWRHILPNVMSLVYIALATSVPGAVTAEAALSWLGFYDPRRMSWGRMLYSIFESGGGTATIANNPLWVLMPGIFISLLAVSFILLGFALDDILNPKLRIRK